MSHENDQIKRVGQAIVVNQPTELVPVGRVGQAIVYDSPAPYRKRRVSILDRIIALWNAKPIMFTTDTYPPHITSSKRYKR